MQLKITANLPNKINKTMDKYRDRNHAVFKIMQAELVI